MRIAINSQTSGKYTEQILNGRNHIVTKMMPICGNTSMNGVYYPLAEVKKSFNQLDNIPAPNGHPKINGAHVSAFSPLAMNAFNVGGFIRNPKMNGKKVIVEFVIDETIANTSDDGREIIKRIKSGDKVGVSTGLNITTVTNEKGTDDLGVDYTRVGEGYNFDHVAILLNETAAGDHAGTELILNTSDKSDPIHVVNVVENNELSSNDLQQKLIDLIQLTNGWIVDLFTDSKTVIYKVDTQLFKISYSITDDKITLSGDPVAVEREPVEYKTQTTNNEDQQMDKRLFILSVIACTNNAFTAADKDRLTAMDETELVTAINAGIDKDSATDFLTANGFDFAGYAEFEANKKDFELFKKSKKKRKDEMTDEIVKNSDYTAELLTGKSEQELLAINSLVTKSKDTKRIPQGGAPSTVNGSDLATDYNY